VISLALSIGLIVVTAMMTPVTQNTDTNNCDANGKCTIKISGLNTDANSIVSSVDQATQISTTTVTVGGVSYEFNGSVKGKNETMSGMKSALGATGNLFGTIIIDIIALVFIWMAFMAGK
jgi:hypothetical protein